MPKSLTAKTVENLKPNPSRRIEIPDPALAGLYLVVQPSGVKSWALRYRFGGKPAKLTLGRWPLMGLADARKAAADTQGRIEEGVNPAAERKRAKADRAEAELTERDKVKTLIEQFDRRHLSKLRDGRGTRQRLNIHVLPVWGEREIQSITRRDVIDLLDGIVDAGTAVTANRIRTILSKFFNWCASRDIIEVPPTLGVKAPVKEYKRDRVLTDDEIRWLWQATGETAYPFGPMARLLLLTGQRLREVSQMTDAEIDGDVWHLAAERTKNGHPHDVPLTDPVRTIIASLHRLDSPAGYIFTTTGKTPVSGFSRAMKILTARMNAIASKERGEPFEIPHWIFHDLRRTAATGMARIGIPVRVTEAVLNHVSGTGGGIVAVYQRHDYADEKRKALEAWAGLVEQIVNGKADNVVRIRG